MVTKAQKEIDYWRNNYSKVEEENDSLKSEIEKLKCKLKEKE
tara:strand:- start:1408 stop:1533 length:126 start_codon:yes stop_codon:yes gene_type:complete